MCLLSNLSFESLYPLIIVGRRLLGDVLSLLSTERSLQPLVPLHLPIYLLGAGAVAAAEGVAAAVLALCPAVLLQHLRELLRRHEYVTVDSLPLLLLFALTTWILLQLLLQTRNQFVVFALGAVVVEFHVAEIFIVHVAQILQVVDVVVAYRDVILVKFIFRRVILIGDIVIFGLIVLFIIVGLVICFSWKL